MDLHEEIDRTLALMEPRFKNAIQVVRDYGDLPRVRCYPGQLNQVFLNLLMNACDAIDGKGVIRIETRRSEDGVTPRVPRHGPGIPPEIQSRIFDPFFTTKPVGVGTGLGLSLSHGIIERHGGRIRVESEPGHGATFVIELPLDATPREEAAGSLLDVLRIRYALRLRRGAPGTPRSPPCDSVSSPARSVPSPRFPWI